MCCLSYVSYTSIKLFWKGEKKEIIKAWKGVLEIKKIMYNP